ncbi:hypothetical protein [Streptomyces sp. NPDC088182]|uniref:hypothetical protein n=1 Tax=Streptomyces sp. NPDC088182 TaxID=3365838 RepID=UPI00380BDEA9
MAIAAIGYPQDGSQARVSIEGSGSPLVAGPRRHGTRPVHDAASYARHQPLRCAAR